MSTCLPFRVPFSCHVVVYYLYHVVMLAIANFSYNTCKMIGGSGIMELFDCIQKDTQITIYSYFAKNHVIF